MGYRGGEYDGLFVASRAAYSSPVAPPPAATPADYRAVCRSCSYRSSA